MPATLKICAVAAMDEGRVIGHAGGIPWHEPEDQKYFRQLTTGHTVVMGRKTYESLPEKSRPLKNRFNVVVSRQAAAVPESEQVKCVASVEQFLESCKRGDEILPSDKVWIGGGEEIYKLSLPFWDELYLTILHSKHDGDTFFPQYENDFVLVNEDKRSGFSFLHYKRKE